MLAEMQVVVVTEHIVNVSKAYWGVASAQLVDCNFFGANAIYHYQTNWSKYRVFVLSIEQINLQIMSNRSIFSNEKLLQYV